MKGNTNPRQHPAPMLALDGSGSGGAEWSRGGHIAVRLTAPLGANTGGVGVGGGGGVGEGGGGRPTPPRSGPWRRGGVTGRGRCLGRCGGPTGVTHLLTKAPSISGPGSPMSSCMATLKAKWSTPGFPATLILTTVKCHIEFMFMMFWCKVSLLCMEKDGEILKKA